MSQSPPRTVFAQQAVDFSEYFGQLFGRVRIGGGCDRRPVLRAPEGMSTAGGRQAVQHIVLEPEEEGCPAVTVGWVDRIGKKARLRTWIALERLHRQRFPDLPFDVDRAGYQTFYNNARRLMESEGLVLEVESRVPRAAGGPGRSSGGGALLAVLVLLLVLLLGTAAAGGVFLLSYF